MLAYGNQIFPTVVIPKLDSKWEIWGIGELSRSSFLLKSYFFKKTSLSLVQN